VAQNPQENETHQIPRTIALVIVPTPTKPYVGIGGESALVLAAAQNKTKLIRAMMESNDDGGCCALLMRPAQARGTIVPYCCCARQIRKGEKQNYTNGCPEGTHVSLNAFPLHLSLSLSLSRSWRTSLFEMSAAQLKCL